MSVTEGNMQAYNKSYRRCKLSKRPFLFIMHNRGRIYASVYYDLYPVDYDLSDEEQKTVWGLMHSVISKSFNDHRHKKKSRVWSSVGPVSGYVSVILTDYARELATGIEMVIERRSGL